MFLIVKIRRVISVFVCLLRYLIICRWLKDDIIDFIYPNFVLVFFCFTDKNTVIRVFFGIEIRAFGIFKGLKG